MNKIYRRLWSTARNCWVVASELTSPRGKASQTVGATAVLAAALCFSPLAAAADMTESELQWWQQQVWLAFPLAQASAEVPAAPVAGLRDIGTRAVNRGTVYSNTSASNWAVISGAETMALGSEAYATAENSLAAGNRARADGANSVVVGNSARSNGTHSTVIGFAAEGDSGGYSTIIGTYAEGRGVGTTTLGHNAKAYAENSIAIGSGARTVDNGGGVSRIAIGGNAYAGSAGYSGAVALGGNARADFDSVVVGHDAKATATGAIALGRESLATESNSVSVGSAKTKRRIVNVQNARLSSGSTDAVTGQQLYSTNQAVSTATNTANEAKRAADQALVNNKLITQTAENSAIRVGGENSGQTISLSNKDGAARYLNGVRNGTLSATSTDAVTGQQLHATNQDVTSARNTANAAKANADSAKATADAIATRVNAARLALGQDAAAEGLDAAGSTAVGVRAKAYNSLAVAMGADARAGVDASGNKAIASGAVAVGAGTRSGDLSVAAGLNAIATGNSAAAVGSKAEAKFTHSTAVGYKAIAGANQATALGREASASGAYSAAVGNLASATADSAVSLGDRAVAGHTGSVALGSGSRTTAANQISVGSSGSRRKIVNVADATLISSSTDAVTGGQLFRTNNNVTAAQRSADDALNGVGQLRGLVSEVANDGAMRLGAENTGAELDVRNKDSGTRRLTGLSDGALGSASTEAVTGRQLHATNQVVDTQGQVLLAHGQTLTAHGQQLGLHDRRIGDNRTDLDKLRADFEDFDPDLDGVVRFAVDGSVDMGGGKVRGVAAGDISSAASTDAVNGGQLFATNQRIDGIQASAQFVAVGPGGPSEPATAGLVAIAIGDSAVASLDSEGGVAVGSFSAALSKNSVALGRASRVNVDAEDGFALGVRSRVEEANGLAIGAASVVMKGANHSVAIGSDSIADAVKTVSFGSDSLKRRLVNVARGGQASDAVVVSQLADSIALLGGGADMDSTGAIVGPSYNVQGAVQSNVGDALTALDSAVLRYAGQLSGVEDRLSSVFNDRPTGRGDGAASIALNGESGMVLSNVADGSIAAGSRDAVNGGQLFEARQQINQNREDLNELREFGSAQAWFVNNVSFEAGELDFNGLRLTGVGMGDIGPNSTDVVVGSQLHATNSRIEPIEAKSKFIQFGDAGAQVAASAGMYAIAIGDSAEASKSGEGGVAVGAYAMAEGVNSVALGRASQVDASARGGFALGTTSRVMASYGTALGAGSQVLTAAVGSVALGEVSVADQPYTISVGSNTLQRRIVNLANGRNATDAATVGQLRGALSTLGADIDAEGNVSTAGFTTQGQHHASLGQALSALDTTVTTTSTRVSNVETQLSSIFSSTPTTQANGTAQLTLAGAQGMVLSNVANGLVAAGSRDAVNGGQLHAVQQQLNGRMDGLEQRVDGQPQARASLAAARTITTDEATTEDTPQANTPQVASTADAPRPQPAAAPTPKADAPEDVKPQVDTADLERMLARANEYTDGISREVDARLNKMDKRFNRMAAMNSAQAAMAMNTAGLATYNRLGAGVGYSDGESAMAVGYQRVLNDKGSATFSLNGAFTNSGERTVGVGVGIGW